MARLFTALDSAVVFPACNFTTINKNIFACWFWPLFDQGDGQDHFFCDMPMHFGYGRFSFGKFSDDSFGGGISYVTFGSNHLRATAGNYTIVPNAWNFFYCEFGGAGGQKMCLNGTEIATGGGGLNPWAGYSFVIGNNSTRNAPASSAIGEMLISGCGGLISLSGWNTPKLASVQMGMLYEKIQFGENQLGIEHHWPLWGIHDPEIDLGLYGRNVAAVYNAPRFTIPPPVQPHSARWWRTPLAACEPFVPPDPSTLGGAAGTIVVPNEGEIIAQQVMFGVAPPEDLWLRLYVNDYIPNELTTQYDFTEPTGANYGPATIVKNTDWTFAAGTPSPALAQSWSRTFSLTDAVGTVYGFWVQGKTSQKVYWAVRYTNPIAVGSSGGEIIIAPTITAGTV